MYESENVAFIFRSSRILKSANFTDRAGLLNWKWITKIVIVDPRNFHICQTIFLLFRGNFYFCAYSFYKHILVANLMTNKLHCIHSCHIYIFQGKKNWTKHVKLFQQILSWCISHLLLKTSRDTYSNKYLSSGST